MNRKTIICAAVATAVFPVMAQAGEGSDAVTSHSRTARHHTAMAALNSTVSDRWVGRYVSEERNFITVKRLEFAKEKDGSLKIVGALVGFPEEVSIGEAVAEPYSERNSRNNPDTMLASFSSEKYKPLLVIKPTDFGTPHLRAIIFTCYMKDVDGSLVHFSGTLNREQ